MDIVRLLNELIAIHARSLPVYLTDAAPWTSAEFTQAHDVMAMVAADHQLTVERLADYVVEKGGTVSLGAFPAEFTGMHDLSMDYMLDRLIEHQQADCERVREIAEAITVDARAKAIADEALGAAKGHLQSLKELRPTTSTAS